jgi:iron(III) transport system permease protein
VATDTVVVAAERPTARSRHRRARDQRRGGDARTFTAVAVVPTVAILGLLILVVWVSFRVNTVSNGWTLQHYRDIVSDPVASRALLNTVGFTAVATATAIALGLPLAWIVERTDLKGKEFIYTLSTIGVFIPGFFSAMGWILFLHPRIGMLNQWLMDWFDLNSAPVNLVSIVGMGFVQGFGLAGLVFVFTTTSLRSMDGSLEEAAAMSGAGPATVLRRVTFPLAWPGILAATIFVVTISISAFDVPLLIGLPNRIYTFSTLLVTLSGTTDDGVGQYGLIAAFGSLMIVVALLLSRWYRRMSERARHYAVVTGKSSTRKVVPLGRWKWAAWAFLAGYFGLAQLMPLVLLVWTALQPYFRPISVDGFGHMSTANFDALPWDLVRRGALNTALLMVLVPVVTFTLSIALSWVVLRTKNRLRGLFDYVAFLPVAVPSLVFAFAALLTVLNVTFPFGIELYGTTALLIIMYSLVSLGFGTRTTNTALIQIHNDLEEAAKVSGAGHLMTVRRVVLPLLLPALSYGALWVALLVSRDITLANVLFSGDNITVSMVVWNVWSSGQLGRASALSLLMMAFFIPLIFLYLRKAGNRGIG